MGSLEVTWADIGCPLAVVGGLRGGLGRLGGAMGGLKLQNIHICEAKTDPGTKSRGAGKHQWCTRDAPRMHRGCTKDAPNGKYGGSVKAKGGFFLKSRAEMVAFQCFLQKCTPPQREA